MPLVADATLYCLTLFVESSAAALLREMLFAGVPDWAPKPETQT
jgi:hypothetical protein